MLAPPSTRFGLIVRSERSGDLRSVMLAVRDTPAKVAVTVLVAVWLTCVVPTLKVFELLPVPITTVAGVLRALLLSEMLIVRLALAA